jgi:hypothetical protein
MMNRMKTLGATPLHSYHPVNPVHRVEKAFDRDPLNSIRLVEASLPVSLRSVLHPVWKDLASWLAQRTRSPAICLQPHLDLTAVSDHLIEIQAERAQNGLRDGANLLVHIVFAIQRMLDIVERLGASGGHHILD